MQLHQSRKRSGLTQKDAARSLRVSQPYLSLLENGDRPLTPTLKRRAVKTFNLAVTELPSLASQYKVAKVTDDQLTADLSALGYPGFSHYKPSPAHPAKLSSSPPFTPTNATPALWKPRRGWCSPIPI